MMLANWTKATTTTTGTGTITLAAVTGYPLPSASRVTGEYVQYSIVTSDSKYESGIGKIAASETLERTKVFSTYDGTTYNQLTASALTLASGTHDVFITPMAEGLFEPLKFPLSGPSSPAVYSTGHGMTTASSGPAAAQRATAWPYRLETSGLLTAFTCIMASTGAGSSTLIGLYEPNSTGKPGRLIAKSGAIDTSTGGHKQSSATANVRLTPGWYWAAMCVTTGSNPGFTGSKQNASAFGAAGTNFIIDAVREDASATDLADPFPSTSFVYTYGSASPYIGLVLT